MANRRLDRARDYLAASKEHGENVEWVLGPVLKIASGTADGVARRSRHSYRTTYKGKIRHGDGSVTQWKSRVTPNRYRSTIYHSSGRISHTDLRVRRR